VARASANGRFAPELVVPFTAALGRVERCRRLDGRVIDYSSKALGRWSAPNWRAGLTSGEVEMNIRAKLVEICDASNAHDLDRIMSFFMDDCVLEMPKAREPYGSRFEDSTMCVKA
jgi:hypothetical protein